MAFTDEQIERYSRHIILKGFGTKGQKRLSAGSVLIVGAGGLGSPAALYLAAAGVGRIGIVDSDVVELSNLQRQIAHATSDIGAPKANSAAASMRAINPDIEVVTHRLFLDASNIADIFESYDFIIDGTDNFPTKFLVNDACVLLGKPFSHGGILRFSGQLMTYVPGEGPCYRCAFKEQPAPGAAPSCAQAGVIGAVAGVVGSLQAMEAIKYLAGIGELLTGKLLMYDALFGDFTELELPGREPKCAVCGDNPTITELKPENYDPVLCHI
ncbi:MAG: HesA/MoeB/ThiF family protein [Eggerthellaceae bacterium]|nr:HesA/MoeB/ThiF family protein [Eggerthellaceae bacterium]MBQ9044304.1 HesA/MoeB/ThiF family protein [Eggerthellaceae bacterium]